MRSGIRGNAYTVQLNGKLRDLDAIFCMPVVPNYFVTYQWVRELRRINRGPLAALIFRVPDEERLLWKHYNGEATELSAAEIVTAALSSDGAIGFEAILPRRVNAEDILRTRSIPQGIGWRYFPGAHGHEPCGCESCAKGQFKARRQRELWEKRGAARSADEADSVG